MNRTLIAAICSTIALTFAGSAHSHELVGANGQPINTHQHVWRQQSYGSDYRQGHSVDTEQGSITVWSPNTYEGYNAGSTVRFARPVPYTGKTKAQDNIPNMKAPSSSTYGKSSKRGNR